MRLLNMMSCNGAAWHHSPVTYVSCDANNDCRSYLVMPLFHVHGLMAGLLAPLAAHASVVLPAAGKFSAQHFWQDMCEYQCTFYTAVPTIHQVCPRGTSSSSFQEQSCQCLFV